MDRIVAKYVVVGAGLAGAATALSLAGRGEEVVLLDRSTPANPHGSSHGSARIFRYAYADPFYAKLVLRAKLAWDEFQQMVSEPVIARTGSLDFGSRRDPQGLGRILSKLGVENELLLADEARGRWPHIAFDTRVLWHPDAGVLDAENAVWAMVRLAVKNGAYLRAHWPVEHIHQHRTGYRMNSSIGDTIDVENVVIAVGGWLPSMLSMLPLPADFNARIPPLTVRQEQAYHFPHRTLSANSVRWPTFVHKTDTIQAYGLPGGRDARFVGQKVAEFRGGKQISSARFQNGLIDPASRQRVCDYVNTYHPGLIPEPYAETTCLFTSTPNDNFILDRVGKLTIVSPCSGHGGKFAPLVGHMAADLATGTRSVPCRFRVAHF